VQFLIMRMPRNVKLSSDALESRERCDFLMQFGERHEKVDPQPPKMRGRQRPEKKGCLAGELWRFISVVPGVTSEGHRAMLEYVSEMKAVMVPQSGNVGRPIRERPNPTGSEL
jgi:hypothetical protein